MYPAHTEPAPGVSVVVPCYDEELAVAETVRRIEAVLGDMPHASELIIVDDFSTDGTRDVLKRIESELDNVRAYFHDRNQGKGRALRTGFEHARGGDGVRCIDGKVFPRYGVLPHVDARCYPCADFGKLA